MIWKISELRKTARRAVLLLYWTGGGPMLSECAVGGCGAECAQQCRGHGDYHFENGFQNCAFHGFKNKKGLNLMID